jgi:hypothetical protein
MCDTDAMDLRYPECPIKVENRRVPSHQSLLMDGHMAGKRRTFACVVVSDKSSITVQCLQSSERLCPRYFFNSGDLGKY